MAQAIKKGKRGRSVGPDGIPTELLQTMISCPTSLTALTDYSNGILRSGDVPQEWDQSVAILIPKLSSPKLRKDLRPIALASRVSKAFSRFILRRLK